MEGDHPGPSRSLFIVTAGRCRATKGILRPAPRSDRLP